MVKNSSEFKSGVITLNRNTFVNDKPANIAYSTPFSSSSNSNPIVKVTSNYEDVEIISSSDSGFSYKSKAQIAPININIDTLTSSALLTYYSPMCLVNDNPACVYHKHVGGSPTGNIYYVRSLDSKGLNWGTPVLVTTHINFTSGLTLDIVNGVPFILVGNQPDTGTSPTYIRSNDTNGTTWGTPGSIGVICGLFLQLLTLGDGFPAIFSNNSTNAIIIRATNISGTTWGSAVIIAPNTTQVVKPYIVNGNVAILYKDNITNKLTYTRSNTVSGSSAGDWTSPGPIIVETSTITPNANPITFKNTSYNLSIINGNPAIIFSDADTNYLLYKRCSTVSGIVATDWTNVSPITIATDANSWIYLTKDVKTNKPYVVYRNISRSTIEVVTSKDINGSSWDSSVFIKNNLVLDELLDRGQNLLTLSSGEIALNYMLSNTSITKLLIGVGTGTNTIAYSLNDGLSWTGLGNIMFTFGFKITYNGSLWVAVGQSTNTIAYSVTGISSWTGLGTSIFSVGGYDIFWNGSLFVAVGSGTNTIAYSSNGTSWTASANGNSIFTSNGNGIAWSSSLNLWVAVGSGTNTITTSSDGITWTAVAGSTSIFSTEGVGVFWNGSLFVAVGQGTNSIAYSSNGTSWTGVSGSTSIFSAKGFDVYANGEKWVAVGQGTNSIAYSTNGTTWTGITGTSIFSSLGRSIRWTGSQWIAGGQGTNSIAYSADGITWSGVLDSLSVFSNIVFGIGAKTAPSNLTYLKINIPEKNIISSNPIHIFVGAGSGTNSLGWSEDGITWNASTNGNTIFSQGYCTSYNGRIWVAGGQSSHTLAYSKDGKTWTGLGNTIFSSWCNVIKYNGTLFVATGVGTNRIAYSYDGINWTGSSSGNALILDQGRGLIWNGSIWVVCGYSASGGNHIVYSSDGINWTGSINGKTILDLAANSVDWDGKLFVATGLSNNKVVYSYDAKTWYASTSGNSHFGVQGGAIGNNRIIWVAHGYTPGQMIWSYDGITWTALPSDPVIDAVSVNNIAWNGKLFVAYGIGTVNRIIYSADGKTWVASSSGNAIFTSSVQGVAWNNYSDNLANSVDISYIAIK